MSLLQIYCLIIIISCQYVNSKNSDQERPSLVKKWTIPPTEIRGQEEKLVTKEPLFQKDPPRTATQRHLEKVKYSLGKRTKILTWFRIQASKDLVEGQIRTTVQRKISTRRKYGSMIRSRFRHTRKLARTFSEDLSNDKYFYAYDDSYVSKSRSREPREIAGGFSEDLADDNDFYSYDSDYDDSENVDDFYEDELEREDGVVAGIGYDEAVKTARVLVHQGNEGQDEAKPQSEKEKSSKMSEASKKDRDKAQPVSDKGKSHKEPKEQNSPKNDVDKASSSSATNPGQIESLLNKLNTLIGDIENVKGQDKKDEVAKATKGVIKTHRNNSNDCTASNHARVTSGFKGYVTYMSSRVLGSLPYMVDGDETFLLHHLDDSTKKDNYKVSVELSSKSCHCINAINVKSVQLERRRHALVTKFTLEYNNGGWNYIHNDDGRIKIFSVDASSGNEEIDHTVALHLRIYARAFRIFPQDWKRLPWVRVTMVECP